MKRTSKIIALCMVLFVTGTFTLPAQMETMEAHAASKVKISKTKATLTQGQTLQLKVKGTKKKAKWSSSKKSVATVNKKGKVTAKKPGKATITAKVGKKALKCKIIVKKKSQPQPTTNTQPSDNPNVPVTPDYVWIPTHGGTKYHSSPDCSNMDGPRQVTVEEALSLGFTPCSKCH